VTEQPCTARMSSELSYALPWQHPHVTAAHRTGQPRSLCDASQSCGVPPRSEVTMNRSSLRDMSSTILGTR